MQDITFDSLYGGMDTRVGRTALNNKLLFMPECVNIDIVGQSLRRARGQTSRVELESGGWLGIQKHEVDGLFYLRGISDNGNYYRIDPVNSLAISAKSSLSSLAKPYMFQGFDNNLICITGTNEVFADDGATVDDIGFYAAYGVYGTVGITLGNNILIADGRTVYYSDDGTIDGWGEANFFPDVNGDIIAMNKFGQYVYVRTKSDIYVITGDNSSNYAMERISSNGGFSRYSMCEFEKRVYAWDKGLYPVEDLGETGQTKIQQDISFRVHESFNDIDKTRLDEIIMIPYPNRKQLWVYVPIENNATLYKAWVANFVNYNEKKLISMYPREANPIICACDFDGKIFTGTSSGIIYQEDCGNTFDGTVIESEFWFDKTNLGSNNYKTVKDIELWVNCLSENQFTVMTRFDGKNYNPSEKTVNVVTNDAYFEIGESELDGVDVLSVSDLASAIVPVSKSKRFTYLQIGIKTENEGDDFILTSLTIKDIEYIKKG
jgi:hypothetical protein